LTNTSGPVVHGHDGLVVIDDELGHVDEDEQGPGDNRESLEQSGTDLNGRP